MSDFSKPAIAQVEALVAATWTDIDVLFRVSQGAWYNWRDRVAAGDMTPPFAVLSVFSEEKADEWGVVNKTYTLNGALYYVRKTDLSPAEIGAGAEKVEDLIYPKMASLRDAFIANTTSWQLIDDPKISVGIDNPANSYLSVNADKFWAGEMTFGILVGETYR